MDDNQVVQAKNGLNFEQQGGRGSCEWLVRKGRERIGYAIRNQNGSWRAETGGGERVANNKYSRYAAGQALLRRREEDHARDNIRRVHEQAKIEQAEQAEGIWRDWGDDQRLGFCQADLEGRLALVDEELHELFAPPNEERVAGLVGVLATRWLLAKLYPTAKEDNTDA